ncbi:MAG: helix-turn-helix domain-containing protein [Opitutaceae bacterium]|nr:helix-turn-helix domain-containing protein [Opitutaceae bacterium]
MPKPIPISIYLHRRASLGFALLLELVFNVANRLAGQPVFVPGFVADDSGPHRFRHGLTLARAPRTLPPTGWLIVPPLDGFAGEFVVSARESRFLGGARERGLMIATSCLGSFLPAGAGLLDGLEATTHWRWAEFAAARFPNVRWNPRSLLCEQPGFVTAGGLLSTVDLALHLVARHCDRELCRDLGRHLLADSVRQKQSAYAASLLLQPRNRANFEALEKVIEARLARPPSIPEMAEQCRMSVRTFHRAFDEAYGVSPGKYLQLKRIERAKELLADERLTIEAVADRCGFSQPAFFRTIFARETGLTPAQFRKRL